MQKYIYIYMNALYVCLTLTLFDVQYRENLVIFGANSMLNLPISSDYNNLYDIIHFLRLFPIK